MKRLIFSILLLINIKSYSQSLDIDNIDSCKNFLCRNVWITKFANEPTLTGSFAKPLKAEKPMYSHENEPIAAKITFYKNGTFKINYNGIEEMGKWEFEGNATHIIGDSVNDRRKIGWEVKRKNKTTGDNFMLVDGNKNKKSSPFYLPEKPYFYRSSNGARAAEGYYVQQ